MNKEKRKKEELLIEISSGVVLCRTKHISHDSISGSVSGGEDSDSEPNKSCSDMSEELQTAFREEIEEGETGRDKLAKVSSNCLNIQLLTVV